jgi:polysaccharide deacetylase 2 family uncharacterized protein YibQ
LAKRKRNAAANRRKKSSGKRPLVALLVVVLLIALAFLVLEKLERGKPVKTAEKPVAVEHYKMPERKEDRTVEQQPYTSAVVTIPPKKLRKPIAGPGTVAIIVDDMGSSVQEVNSLMTIKLPLTFSIIPGLARSREVAEAAHAKGFQVMLHMPMEPQGYPRQRMEQNGLLLSLSDAEIQTRLNSFLQGVPYVVGANNHMGSRFTEDRAKMGTVLGFLKGKGLFFIDSRTSPNSVGYSLAREMGLETAARNVFLDNVQDIDAIRRQLDELAGLARKKGVAIGICHPHKPTILALIATMPELRRKGINFVYVSDLVK